MGDVQPCCICDGHLLHLMKSYPAFKKAREVAWFTRKKRASDRKSFVHVYAASTCQKPTETSRSRDKSSMEIQFWSKTVKWKDQNPINNILNCFNKQLNRTVKFGQQNSTVYLYNYAVYLGNFICFFVSCFRCRHLILSLSHRKPDSLHRSTTSQLTLFV